MKTKDIIYIIAAIGAVVLFVMDKDLEYVSGAILIVLLIASKFGEKQAESKVTNLKQENQALRSMHKVEFRKNQLKNNVMTDTEAEVISAQLNYVNNLLGATHSAKQVHEETIENFVSVIGGGGIKNNPPS